MKACECASLLERVQLLEQEQRRILTMIAAINRSEADAAGAAPSFTFRGPWFSTAEAAAYVPCKTVNAFSAWRVRHGIISRSNGSVAKADLDRVLNRRKLRRVSPASLANLRRRGRQP